MTHGKTDDAMTKQLIDTEHVCFILNISRTEFSYRFRKSANFPKPIATIKKDKYYDKTAIDAYAQKFLTFDNIMASQFIRGEFNHVRKNRYSGKNTNNRIKVHARTDSKIGLE